MCRLQSHYGGTKILSTCLASGRTRFKCEKSHGALIQRLRRIIPTTRTSQQRNSDQRYYCGGELVQRCSPLARAWMLAYYSTLPLQRRARLARITRLLEAESTDGDWFGSALDGDFLERQVRVTISDTGIDRLAKDHVASLRQALQS